MTKFPIGAFVIYHGKSYSFPGEVTMRDETGVVVKAFGDIEGNYTGMKHIYADGVLQEYVFGDGTAHHCPALVIFHDDNPIAKMRQWVTLYGERPKVKGSQGMETIRKLLQELDRIAEAIERSEAPARLNALADFPSDWAEREADLFTKAAEATPPLTAPDTRIKCDYCGGSGWIGHGMSGDSCGHCHGRGYN